VIRAEVDALAAWAAAACGRGEASDGAAQAIITKAATRMNRPATPVSHVALACSGLTTAVTSPPGYSYDQLRSAWLAARRLAVTRPTPWLSASRHRSPGSSAMPA
jgi:hypothetical protein